MAAEAIFFPIAIVPLSVGVHLVGGHHHHRARVLQWLERFEQVAAQAVAVEASTPTKPTPLGARGLLARGLGAATAPAW